MRKKNNPETSLKAIKRRFDEMWKDTPLMNDQLQFAIYNPFTGRIEGYGTLEEIKAVHEIMKNGNTESSSPIGLS